MGDWNPTPENAADDPHMQSRNVDTSDANVNNPIPQHNNDQNARQIEQFNQWQKDYLKWLLQKPTPPCGNLTSNLPVCRDYLRNRCRRVRCIFHHPPTRQDEAAYRDFLNQRLSSWEPLTAPLPPPPAALQPPPPTAPLPPPPAALQPPPPTARRTPPPPPPPTPSCSHYLN